MVSVRVWVRVNFRVRVRIRVRIMVRVGGIAAQWHISMLPLKTPV